MQGCYLATRHANGVKRSRRRHILRVSATPHGVRGYAEYVLQRPLGMAALQEHQWKAVSWDRVPLS